MTNNYRTSNPIPKHFELTKERCRYCGQPLAVESWNSTCKGLKCVNPACPLWYSDQGYIPIGIEILIPQQKEKQGEPTCCSICGAATELLDGLCVTCWDANTDNSSPYAKENPLYDPVKRPLIIKQIKKLRKARISINRTAALLGIGRNSVIYWQKEENVL